MSLPEVSRGCRFKVVKTSKEWQGVAPPEMGTSGDGWAWRAGYIGWTCGHAVEDGTSGDGLSGFGGEASGGACEASGEAPPEMGTSGDQQGL
jgi:hypothetical protein